MRRLTLEERIARLEKLSRKFEMTPSERNAAGKAWLANIRAQQAAGKSMLNRSASASSLESDVRDWFENNMGPDMYSSKRAWMSDLRAMKKGMPNGSAADDCCDEVGCDDINEVTDLLAGFADEALNDISYNKAHGQDVVFGIWNDPWA